MTMPAGSVIGSIVVEEKLSSGATGEHYLGRQPALERTVALHKLPRNLSASPGVIERFQREARLGAQVLHPNLVQVFDLFSHRGDHYLVREHVEGAELSAVLERSGRLPARIVVRIVLELARALGSCTGAVLFTATSAPRTCWSAAGARSSSAAWGARSRQARPSRRSRRLPLPIARPSCARAEAQIRRWTCSRWAPCCTYYCSDVHPANPVGPCSLPTRSWHG